MTVNTNILALNIVKSNAELESYLSQWRSDNQKIGFVPTMGALHHGHLHLINEAKQHSNKTICSIFVNPTQFNEKSDFERYPRNLDKDIEKLSSTSCDLLYAPGVEDIYDPTINLTSTFDFGNLGDVMEGKHRPGHFNGVATVVKRLFELVNPHVALFGLKDYQQYSIIKKLVGEYKMLIDIIGVPTIRESDGLAMSSRNALLEPLHRELAPIIYESMCEVKKSFSSLPLTNLKLMVEQRLQALPDVVLDYVEIADSNTLQSINVANSAVKARIFIAVFFGKIRLIDNLELN